MEYVDQTSPASEAGARDVIVACWRRKWIIVAIMAASLGTTIFLTRRMPRLYRATAQMMVMQSAPGSNSSTPDAQYNSPILESPATQLAMLSSDGMPYRTISWLKNDALSRGESRDKEGMVDDASIWRNFTQDVKFANPENTNILTVTVTQRDPVKCSALANAVCQSFVAWKKDIAQRRVQDVTTSLEDRALRAKRKMEETERRETAFKQQRKLVDVPSQQKATLDQYLARDTEVTGLRGDVETAQVRLRNVAARLRDTNEAIASAKAVRDDSLAMSLQKQLTDLQIERSTAALKYTPEYPGVLPELDARILDLKERLAKSIKATLDNRPSLQSQGSLADEYRQAQTALVLAKVKLAASTRVRDQLQNQTVGMPNDSMQYARLERDADISRTLYQNLQGALNAARLNKDMAVGNVQLTAWAMEPDEPFQPDMGKNLALGSLIGLALAFGCALLLEQADRRVRTLQDVRKLASGPVIGTLPRMSRRQLAGLSEGELPAPVMEAYSMARANLAMALRKAGCSDPWKQQVILFTSSVPGEGKSVTAAQMARSLARSGSKVILVDADMRRPAQNRLFGSAEPVGLADVLTSEVSLTDALVTSDTDNLWILHSGSAPRNPTELVSRPILVEVLNALRKEADVVLVDAPACAVVADALLIAPHVDCIFHVIGSGMVDADTMCHTTAALNAAAPKTMVFFVNRAPRETGSPYKNYYSYRYAYSEPGSSRPTRPNQEPLQIPPAGGDADGSNTGQPEA